MATMYYDDAADLALIRGKKVAIIGYGSQGHAHALNLQGQRRRACASGCRRRAGRATKAQAAGLTVGDVAEVAEVGRRHHDPDARHGAGARSTARRSRRTSRRARC